MFSQTSGGPDGYGYTWVDSNNPNGPVYNWIDIESTNNLVSGLGDDNIIGSFPIACFNYYLYTFSALSIVSNGYISLSIPHTISSPFPIIPSASCSTYFIALFSYLHLSSPSLPILFISFFSLILKESSSSLSNQGLMDSNCL